MMSKVNADSARERYSAFLEFASIHQGNFFPLPRATELQGKSCSEAH